MNQYDRIIPSTPRGLLAATAIAIALTWVAYALDTTAWPGRTGAVAVSAALAGNVLLTSRWARLKVRLVRLVQRRLINPVVRGGLLIGLNPLGVVLLETIGRRSGEPRQTVVGNGRGRGDAAEDFWIVAEHGYRAAYVRNLIAQPRVRVRVGWGPAARWVDAVAEVRPDLDPRVVQRHLVGWHPLRAVNALTVRILGAELLVVHLRLEPQREPAAAGR